MEAGLMHEAAASLLRAAAATVRGARGRLLNRLDPPVVVLIYHRVVALASDPQLLAVTPANFRAQLLHLRERFSVVRLEEDWTKVGEPAVAITFDDGYADNVTGALPILEELELPATFFVTTGQVGSDREFWWDDLERVLLGPWRFPPQLTVDEAGGRTWPTRTAPERAALYAELHPVLKRLDPASRERWLDRLRRWSGAGGSGRPQHRAMTLEQLRRLAASRWATVGAHTVTHTPLSALPPAAQREEIEGSKRQLEAWIGREVAVFSYPFGTRRDYTRASRDLSAAAGFTKTAANFPGQAHRWTDPHQLPRQLVRNWTGEEFAARLRSFWVR